MILSYLYICVSFSVCLSLYFFLDFHLSTTIIKIKDNKPHAKRYAATLYKDCRNDVITIGGLSWLIQHSHSRTCIWRLLNNVHKAQKWHRKTTDFIINTKMILTFQRKRILGFLGSISGTVKRIENTTRNTYTFFMSMMKQ